MKALLLAASVLVFASPQPVRWLPVVFERAAWLPGKNPTLLTDLGRFTWDGHGWSPGVPGNDPLVPANRPFASAAVGEELVLSPGRAVALLTDDGKRIVVLRPQVSKALSLTWEGDGQATSLRLLGDVDNAWLLQGIAVAGDAKLGVFLLRLEKGGAGAAWVHPFPKEGMPAFVRGSWLGNSYWVTPDSQSESQDAWALQGKIWRREPPPTSRSVLLDVWVGKDAAWFAYSDGVGRVNETGRTWYALTADLVDPRWICLAPQGNRIVRGRWMRGSELVGWGVGEALPVADYPLDGSSCSFFTNASATQGLVSPPSVKILLNAAGVPPVMRR